MVVVGEGIPVYRGCGVFAMNRWGSMGGIWMRRLDPVFAAFHNEKARGWRDTPPGPLASFF